MMIPAKVFASISVMTVADLPRQPSVKGSLVFSQFSDKDSIKHLLGMQLWHLLKYAELTEVVRQKDKLLIDLLHKVQVGNIDDDDQGKIYTRIWWELSKRYLAHVWREWLCHEKG